MLINKKKITSITAVVLSLLIVISIFVILSDEDKPTVLPDLEEVLSQMTGTSSVIDYDTYIQSKVEIPEINKEVVINKNTVIKEGENYTFSVDMSENLASIKVVYKINSDNNGDASCGVEINGKRPFREATEFILKRNWMSGKNKDDDRGNEYTVPLIETEEWQTSVLTDSTGFHSEPFNFHFTNGKNNITLTATKGNIQLKSIILFPYKKAETYKEISKDYSSVSNDVTPITLEAEKPYLRTNASITELCDRNSSVTTPVFDGQQVWNSLGGSGWSRKGESVSWKINVNKTGYYTLAFRFKNNFVSGLSTYRKLMIDGEIPFSEMESVAFKYGTGWQSEKISDQDGNPYLYYLTEGEHILTLEVTLGEQAKALNVAQKSLSRLNEAYRKILMVTGATPDKYRDYQIEKNLPDVLEIFKEQKDVLGKLTDWLYLQNGGKGEGSAKIDEIILRLKKFLKDPEIIPEHLTVFSSDLTGLSDWIQSSTSQPLIIDCIQLLPENKAQKNDEANFFKKLFYGIKIFIKSFAEDYGVIGSIHKKDEAVEVWITLGRDQYQILKELIDNDFTQKSGIGVNLKLVSGGILQATVAGIEPDISLFDAEGVPMNFAARGALLDLSKFSDFGKVSERFSPQTLVPYTYDGGVYGLPLTQTYNVMFVRDDILAEIGLEVPETWDDIYNCLTVLQQNHMEFAYPSSGGVSGFALFLFQKQQNIYKDNGKSADINTPAAIEAFEKWTKLYSEYSLLMSYDFVNRFRSGDMPIGIIDFNTFNTLEVSAPEIKGLWSMHPIPGTVGEDGTIRNISLSATAASMIMKTTKLPQQSWEFLNWFTTADAQYSYATMIENKLGVSGRYATANIEAFNRLSWTADALETLKKQRENALSIQQVPGGYFLDRHVNNIFRKVINESADVRETVNEYTELINAELTKKRKEFGLEVD